MAETKTKTQRSKAAKATAAQGRVAARTPKTVVDGTTERSVVLAQSVEDAQRAAGETVYRFLETAERLPREVAVELADLLGHLARVEYGVLRSIMRGAVDVDVNVGVNVDVLPKGVHVDVLSGGVNVDVLSRKAT